MSASDALARLVLSAKENSENRYIADIHDVRITFEDYKTMVELAEEVLKERS